ncbi:MAG: thioredoxin family protein [Deltaproteobacteria bacterium]|nr:thioredoxin family protein [Deltaproteobacteria bacterium]
MSKVIELNDDTFKTAIADAPLAFVDFYADWCGPCRLFSPVFSRVAEKHDDLRFFKIDGDLHAQSRADVTIDNLPFVAAYRNGAFIEGFSTTVEAGLESFIARMKAKNAK